MFLRGLLPTTEVTETNHWVEPHRDSLMLDEPIVSGAFNVAGLMRAPWNFVGSEGSYRDIGIKYRVRLHEASLFNKTAPESIKTCIN